MGRVWEESFMNSAKELGYFTGRKGKRKRSVVFRYLTSCIKRRVPLVVRGRRAPAQTVRAVRGLPEGALQVTRETRGGDASLVAVGASRVQHRASREPCGCSQSVLEEAAAGWVGHTAGWGWSCTWRGQEVLRPVRLGLGPDLRVPDGRGWGHLSRPHPQ